MPSDTDPTLILVTTTATLPREGEGLARDTEWLKRDLEWLHCCLENRTKENRNLDSNRIDQEYRINRLKGEVDDARDIANKLADEKNELRKENASLRAELAKRDDLIAHYKIGEAGWQEEAKGLEAKVRNLQANLDGAHRGLAKRDETIAKLSEENRILDANLEQREAVASELEAKAAVYQASDTDHRHVAADLRERLEKALVQLARAEAIEEATRALRAHLRPRGGHRWAADAEAALSRVDAALVSPIPRDTAEGEAELRERVETLRRLGEAMRELIVEYRGERWSNTLHERSKQALDAWSQAELDKLEATQCPNR